MPLIDYRLLTFGCFGTLIDRDAGIAAALRPLLARAGLAMKREALLEAFARHEAAALQGGAGLPHGQLLGEAHRELAREWGVVCAPADHDLFARSITDWPAYPDAAGSLQYLRRYFRLAVLSNADRDTLLAVGRRFDLRFDALWSAQDVGAFKPDTRCFEHLLGRLDRLGVTARQSLHVAASLPHDLLPASSCGLSCAWIDRAGASASGGAPRRLEHVFPSVAHLVRAHQDHLRA